MIGTPLPAPINSGNYADSPQISPDGNTLTWSSSPIDYTNGSGVVIGGPLQGWPTDPTAAQWALQIVQARRIGGVWQQPVCLPKPINQDYAWSADGWVSENNQDIIFTSVTPKQLASLGSRFGIFVFTAGTFGLAKDFGYPMDGTDENPHITRDALTLFFESERFHPIGFKDIVVSRRRSRTAPWSDPVSVGATVNKPNRINGSPSSLDGLDLWFDNRGAAGGGIWHSIDTGQGNWSEPVLVVPGAVGDPSVTIAGELYYTQVVPSAVRGQNHGQIMYLPLKQEIVTAPPAGPGHMPALPVRMPLPPPTVKRGRGRPRKVLV